MVVDRQNQVGELYGFRAAPNGILINEDGSLFRSSGGFEIRREATEELARAMAGGATGHAEAARPRQCGTAGGGGPPLPGEDGPLR